MPTKPRSVASRSRNRRAAPNAVADRPPAWIKPQLATLVKEAPDGSDWLHEIKLDGYRMHARLDAGRVQILTRRGNDWTDKYPFIAEAIADLPVQNAYLDGELCGVMPDGRTAFNLIQNATAGSLIFFVFDLLFLNGENLMTLPLVDRKARLKKLLTNAGRVCFAITITKSVEDRLFTDWSVNMAWKGSSPSAPMRGMSLTGAPG